MCFLVDDEENEGYKYQSGAAKMQMARHHTWLIPRRLLVAIFGAAVVVCVLAMLLMIIGSGIGSVGLRVTGGILFGLSILAFIVCLLICLYAYFYYGTKEQAVQTEMTWADDSMTDGPGFTTIGRPSALKSADSTLKRNGLAGQKKVTMAPELGPYGGSSFNASQGVNIDSRTRSPIVKSPSSSGALLASEVSDPRGAGGRNVGGAEVGTGGIRITTLDRNQPFPSPGSQAAYGSGQSYSGYGGVQAGYGGPGHVIYSGGGSSASSSMDTTYAYPKSVAVIQGVDSGFNESTTGSQYSTLRSIPVTHLVSDSPRQQQDSMEYARINKQPKNVHTISGDFPQQRGYIVQGQQQQGQGYSQVQGQQQHGQGYSQVQGQFNQFEQRFPVADDFDYDNPVERTPMISPKKHQPHSSSYHEQQMQYQRQQHREDLHAPRQLNIQSLQRQTASNPYRNFQQEEDHHQHRQQQQQQHQMQYQSSTSTPQKVTNNDLPDLQPLVYPSARRPMTFEQLSSSKVSMYDNVLAGLNNMDD